MTEAARRTRRLLRNIPAATLLRAQPTSPLAATRAGNAVHVLNRSGGRPLCGRNRRQLTDLAVDPQVPPPMRVCAFCVAALPGWLRDRLATHGAPTEAELTAVHDHAARQDQDVTGGAW